MEVLEKSRKKKEAGKKKKKLDWFFSTALLWLWIFDARYTKLIWVHFARTWRTAFRSSPFQTARPQWKENLLPRPGATEVKKVPLFLCIPVQSEQEFKVSMHDTWIQCSSAANLKIM